MPKYIFLTLLIIPILNLQSDSFSVMTFNVENLFDTQDDYKKDDKAFLPLAKKQLNKRPMESQCRFTQGCAQLV